MGTWGHNSFENDTALDMLDMASSGDLEQDDLRDALHLVLQTDDYLDADIAQEAVAVAEILAAAKGNPTADTEWHPKLKKAALATSLAWTPADSELAARALDRILASGELHELWTLDGGEDGPKWEAAVHELMARLKA